MEFGIELTYLSELQVTLDILEVRGNEMLEARDRWVALDERLVSDSGEYQGSASDVGKLTSAQRDLWLGLEAFLGAWARASLLLFPTGGSQDRGRYLTSVLAIGSDHLLADRDLRNDWMHFDERLDSAVENYGRINAQRFERSLDATSKIAIRYIAMEPLSVAFLGKRAVNLERMIAGVRELKSRLNTASRTLGERNPPSTEGHY